jgi:outer membrane lipoprotein-sorting protein
MPAHRGGSSTRVLASLAAVALCVLSITVVADQKPGAAAPTAGPSFDELYRRGQTLNAGIKTLTARFTETTTPSLLERPLVSRGMLYVQRTGPAPRVALHYTYPDVRTVLIDGNRMTTSWPSRNIRTYADISRAQRNVQKYFTSNDAGELRKVFDITLRAASSRPGTYEVLMVPKQKRISEALKGLELWAEDSSGLLKAMRMTFANGDLKLMDFEDVTPNAAIDPAVFSVPK